MTNRQIDPEAHRVIVGNVPESRLDELMGLISDFAVAHSLPVAVQPNVSPASEQNHNPDGYNPLLVSYIQTEGPDERIAIPVLPAHKLSAYAKNNGYAHLNVDGFPRPYKDLITHIKRLRTSDFRYIGTEYTISGILRADRLEELITEAGKRPDEYKFTEDQLAFLEVCAANLKLDPPHPLRPSTHVADK